MNKEIKELKEEIKMEQMQYDIACDHPTEASQFYRALEKQRIRLNEMKQRLIDLKQEEDGK